MASDSKALRVWVHEPLTKEVRRALARLARLDDVAVVAVMPDVHLAKAVCVGAVVATETRLFPDAVGGDIGCGMAAVRFDASASSLETRAAAAAVLEMLSERVPCSRRPAGEATLPEALASRALSSRSLERKKNSIGRVQFATLGRGNHFVEFQTDDEGQLWLMLHSGSRGIGQGIREHHGGGDGSLQSLAADSAEGRAYYRDLSWALDYARLSRRRMVELIGEGVRERIGLSVSWESFFDCHHNFVRRESHEGRSLWVHRKGAISAGQGEPGIIPGSMASPSYHVTGRGNPASLCSSSHGAGRVMSRTEARRRVSTRVLLDQMRGVWFDEQIANRLRDEAPEAYKKIGAVMRAQRDLTRIVRRLRPLLAYKGP